MTTRTEMSRRALLTAGVAGVALSLFGRWSPATATEGEFEVMLRAGVGRPKPAPRRKSISRANCCCCCCFSGSEKSGSEFSIICFAESSKGEGAVA